MQCGQLINEQTQETQIKSNSSTQPGSCPFKRQGGDPLEMVLSNLKSNIILTHSQRQRSREREKLAKENRSDVTLAKSKANCVNQREGSSQATFAWLSIKEEAGRRRDHKHEPYTVYRVPIPWSVAKRGLNCR